MIAGRDGPLVAALSAIAVGAVGGAWLRWGLAYWLNPRLEHLPLGTLAANLVGGYLVGIAVAILAAYPGISPFWRLLVVTGFLGGLTTFSTFSAEVVAHLQEGRIAPALLVAITHVTGSLLMTALGFQTARSLS